MDRCCAAREPSSHYFFNEEFMYETHHFIDVGWIIPLLAGI